MVRFLARQGFALVRIRGSHHFLEGAGKRTTVPVHGNRRLKIGTLRSILRDLNMTPTEFESRWRT
jgi:predicted RNA binding protein YcfA (HicA-like mRNA interferase family)